MWLECSEEWAEAWRPRQGHGVKVSVWPCSEAWALSQDTDVPLKGCKVELFGESSHFGSSALEVDLEEVPLGIVTVAHIQKDKLWPRARAAWIVMRDTVLILQH